MRGTIWLLLAGAAGAALLLAKKVHGLSQLNFQIPKIAPRLDGLKVYLDVDVLVQNPTDSTGTITAFVLDLIYKGQVVANAAHYTPIQIQEYGNTKIVFPFKLSLFGAGATLWDIISGKLQASAQITLKGTVTVNGIPVPVSITSNVV